MNRVFIAILFMVSAASAQFDCYFDITSPVKTDSIVWRTVDTVFVGRAVCSHSWVLDKEYRSGGNFFCAVNHLNEHCGYDDRMRHKICRNCLREEIEREFWYQSIKREPENEYSKLKKLQIEQFAIQLAQLWAKMVE